MNLAETLKRLLEQIAESAYEASGYASQLKFEGQKINGQLAESESPADPEPFSACPSSTCPSSTCLPQCLPAPQAGQAVELAIDTRTDNAPTISRLKAVFGDRQPVDPRLLSHLTSRFWEPDRQRLAVSFLGDIPARLRARFMMHLNQWSQAGGIRFVLAEGPGEVRIACDPSGNWSYTGTDIRLVPVDRATTNFDGLTMQTSDQDFGRIVQHQAGHLLGFRHRPLTRSQMKRVDVEKTRRYLYEFLGWDQQIIDYYVFPSVRDRSDQRSIMSWPLPGSVTSDGQPCHPDSRITDSDRQQVRRIYGSTRE